MDAALIYRIKETQLSVIWLLWSESVKSSGIYERIAIHYAYYCMSQRQVY
jgi:hypothetical protein